MKQIVKKTTLSLIATILLIVPQPSNAATWKEWFLGTTIAAIILRTAYQSYKNYTKENLFEAIHNNDIPRVKDCIFQGADINIKDNNGLTPLHHAARYADHEMVELLIKNGADIHIKDNNGRTPLHIATKNMNIKIIQLLIQNSAHVNIQNNYGDTPLHYAVYYEHLKAAELLIENGADINIKDNNGKTPLHRAAFYGYIEIAKLFIENGADIHIKDNNGRTPLDIARQNNQQVMVTYLQNVQNEFTTFKINPSNDTIYAPTSAYLKMFCKSTDFKMLCEDKFYKNSLNFYILSNFYTFLDKTHHNNLEIVTENLSNNNKNNIIKLGFYLTPEEFKMKKSMLHFNQHVDCKILYEDKKFSL